MDPNRKVADDVESKALAPTQGTAPSESRPVTISHRQEAREAFFQMMNEWFAEFKQGVEQFRANIDDDPERAEYWLENSIRVFDELSCTPEECLKCTVSLWRDSSYQWWNTLISVVPRERVTWDFFQDEFRKKYISERFIDQKHREF
ncbi:maturase K [Gossypium australe]|uniref:Maturase K n=1 Tax=Gossypium australe TaxID=47621 RepID=A0A5B6WUT5_9ROSI|nr:maturase K [Gossypium australe]